MVEVSSRIRIVEAFGEAVDEDAGIRARHHNARVGAVLVAQRQEARSLRVFWCLNKGLLVAALVCRFRRLDGAHTGNSEEAAAAEEETKDDHGKGHADCGVDAIFNGRKDRHQDTGQEDDDLDGRHAPELEDDSQRRDDVAHGVDNHGGECGVGDVVEESGEGIQSQEHDNGRDDAGKRRADAGLGLDGGTGEGSGRGICAQEGAQQVGDADGHEFLRRVDDVVVDAAKRLGDGNVLNQHDDDGGGQLRRKGLDDGRVDFGSARVLEASRHLAQDADRGLLLVVQHHASADARVQQNHKRRAQRRDEKVQLGPLRLLLGHVSAESPDEIQHQQRRQAQRRVNRRRRQALERVDDDQIRGVSRVDALDAHQLGHLAGDDVDGRARHEGADGRQRDELDEPAQTGEADEADDGAGDDGQRRGDNVAGDVGESCCGFEDDIAGDLGHDGNGLKSVVSWFFICLLKKGNSSLLRW